ncbi:MAG: putative lipid II flippase FtsW [Mycobacteriaceae bacterium]
MATPSTASSKSTSSRADFALPRTRFGLWLTRPLTSFHLIITTTALLTIFGLVMVLSASGVESYTVDGSPYTMFSQQLLVCLLGVCGFYAALRVPIRVLRKLSFPALIIAIILLVMVLVPGIGIEVDGGRRWINVGPLTVQPSEIAKVTLAIWGAHMLASRRKRNATLKELLVPLIPVTLLIAGLIVLENSLSTAISVSIVVIGLLWFAGLPLRVFLSTIAGAVLAATILALTAGYRSARVHSLFNPGADPQGAGYQARQAKYALADGGIFGNGLGQSVAKWSYLPNAHNDFIFAIIGEELGFIGCLAVLALFALFAYTGLRISLRSVDPFLRLLAGTSTVWIIGQAFINIGYVVGILPVTGLQLPLISAGGSSTAVTLTLFGILANAARHEPEAVAALHSGSDNRFIRLLRLPKPEPYSPSRAEALRNKLDARRARANYEETMFARQGRGWQGDSSSTRSGSAQRTNRKDLVRRSGNASAGRSGRR